MTDTSIAADVRSRTSADRDGPSTDRYDVVIVGAGLGGLSAGALLAKAGRSVLVAEQGESPGGYAHAFKRGPYTFDPAIHRIPQGHEGGLSDGLFRYLGIRDRVELRQTEVNYQAKFPDRGLTVPFGMERQIEVHSRLFPQEAEGIERFYRTCDAVHLENHELPPRIGLAGLDEAAKRFPTLFKYLRATLADVLDEYLTDPQLKGLCSVIWPHLGTPPSRLSFVTFALATSMCAQGIYYCMGSFESLVRAFVSALEAHGGELVVRSRVSRVVVDDGRVTGVLLEGGREVRAPVVVSNADARQTFEELVGEELLPPRFMNRLRRMRPSCSAVVVTAATTLDLRAAGVQGEMFRPLGYDHEDAWRRIRAAEPDGMWGAFPTLDDSSLAPPGEHVMTLTSLAPFEAGRPWEELIEPYADRMLAEFEQVLPGLRDSLTFMEAATPETLQRFCLNQQGAIYGWENSPTQTGGKRSSPRAPLEGLFLAGHWTQPGTASLRVIVSGLQAAQMVLQSTGSAPLDFRHADMPPM